MLSKRSITWSPRCVPKTPFSSLAPYTWSGGFAIIGNRRRRSQRAEKHRKMSASSVNARMAKVSISAKLPLVGIIMGSSSDWETLEHAAKTLEDLGVPHETSVVSAHRTPDLLFEYAASAEKRGIEVIIAGAGGAAHLPGMTASKTVLPVLGVPVESKALKGLDSLLSIAQMPAGIPVGPLAIGRSRAGHALLLAAAIVGAQHPEIRGALRKFRANQRKKILATPIPAETLVGGGIPQSKKSGKR